MSIPQPRTTTRDAPPSKDGLLKVLRAIADLSDTNWELLPPTVQRWYNYSCEQFAPASPAAG